MYMPSSVWVCECAACSEQKEQHVQSVEIDVSMCILGAADCSWESTHHWLPCQVRFPSMLCCVPSFTHGLQCTKLRWSFHEMPYPSSGSWYCTSLVFQTTPRVCYQWPQGGILGTFMNVGGEDASPSRWWAAEGIQPLHHQQNSQTPCSSLRTETQTSRLVKW